jgi:hypothetical protein
MLILSMLVHMLDAPHCTPAQHMATLQQQQQGGGVSGEKSTPALIASPTGVVSPSAVASRQPTKGVRAMLEAVNKLILILYANAELTTADLIFLNSFMLQHQNTILSEANHDAVFVTCLTHHLYSLIVNHGSGEVRRSSMRLLTWMLRQKYPIMAELLVFKATSKRDRDMLLRSNTEEGGLMTDVNPAASPSAAAATDLESTPLSTSMSTQAGGPASRGNLSSSLPNEPASFLLRASSASILTDSSATTKTASTTDTKDKELIIDLLTGGFECLLGEDYVEFEAFLNDNMTRVQWVMERRVTPIWAQYLAQLQKEKNVALNTVHQKINIYMQRFDLNLYCGFVVAVVVVVFC